ncbi:MAG: MMPL family transporter [Woeseiaceae bacterium]
MANSYRDWLHRSLRRWTRLAVNHALVVVVASAAVTGLLALYVAGNLSVNTDTADMISPELPWRHDYIRYRDDFPLRSNTIIVVVTAPTGAIAEQAVAHLDELSDGLEQHVLDSNSPTSDPPLAGRELLYLDMPQLIELADSLATMQPFLGRLREDYDLPALIELIAMAAERDSLSTAATFIDEIDRIVETSIDGGDLVLDWGALNAVGGLKDSTRRLIVVKPVLEKGNPRPAQASIAALREAGRQTEQVFRDQLSVRLTGVVAVADDEFLSVTGNAGRIGTLALLGVIIVLVAAFRSARLIIASIITLLAGLIGTAAFAAFSVGSLNVISVAFAVLYIGLGIDFVIHYLLRVRELAAQDTPLANALEDAGAEVGGSLIICATTTAAGFYSFIPTAFSGVSQLGLISGTGMFISLAVTLTVLPALMRLLFGERLPVGTSAARWAPGLWLSGLIGRHRTAVLIPIFLAAAAGVLFLPQIHFESDPMLLLDPGTESVKTFRELSRHPETAPRSISVVVESTADAQALQTELKALPTVERSLSLQSFTVVDYAEKLEALDELLLLLGHSFSQFGTLEPASIERTRAAIVRLEKSVEAAGANPDTALARLSRTLNRLDKDLAASDTQTQQENLNKLQFLLLADLPRAMELLSSRLQPTAMRTSDFPRSFIRKWQSSSGSEIVDIIPSLDITKPENAARFVTDIRSLAPHATGLPVVYQESGNTVLESFKQAFLYALVAVSLLLLLFLRSATDSLLVLVPMGLAVTITAAFMAMIDLPLNFANVIALPLLLGIGVDTGIHIVHRARQTSGASTNVLTTSTSRAILFSGITTLASFGSLAVSTHLGMASMGKLLTAGLIAILIVMIIVLPALLRDQN